MLRALTGLIMALFMSLNALAQSVSDDIFVVDLVYIAEKSEVGKQVYARYLEHITLLKRENEAISQRLSQQEQELTEKRDQMNAEEFGPLAEEFNKQSEYERERSNALKQEADNTYALHSSRLSQLIMDEVRRVAVERGAPIILDSRNVVFFDPAFDLTPLVIERLDDRFSQDRVAIEDYIYAQPSEGRSLTGGVDLGKTIGNENEEVAPNEQ